jgi:hypothetical protein
VKGQATKLPLLCLSSCFVKFLKMETKLKEIKPIIRAVLLSLARTTCDYDFLRHYYHLTGESFLSVLREFDLSFEDFMLSIPDVCRISKGPNFERSKNYVIEYVPEEKSSHLKDLTFAEKKKPKTVLYSE